MRTKEAALSNLRAVAIEVTSLVTQKLLGEAPDRAQVEHAVDGQHAQFGVEGVARCGRLTSRELGSDHDVTEQAHRLGFTGPAVSVQTACSTSLVATALAMDSLRSGGCDVALAGGVAITCPPNSGYFFQDGSMASPDGHTRAFDALSAPGFIQNSSPYAEHRLSARFRTPCPRR